MKNQLSNSIDNKKSEIDVNHDKSLKKAIFRIAASMILLAFFGLASYFHILTFSSSILNTPSFIKNIDQYVITIRQIKSKASKLVSNSTASQQNGHRNELNDLLTTLNNAIKKIDTNKTQNKLSLSDLLNDPTDQLIPRINRYIEEATKLNQTQASELSIQHSSMQYLLRESEVIEKSLYKIKSNYYQNNAEAQAKQLKNIPFIVLSATTILLFFLYILVFSPIIHLIRKSRQDALQATKAKNEFLASVSHEIRTPMHGIIGASENMLDSNLTDKQKKYADAILDSAESLLNVIDDILGYTELDSGELEVSKEEFHLPTIIEDLVQLFSDRASKSRIKLDTVYQDNVPEVILNDAAKIRKIIYHLLVNAIKFTPQGKVEIVVEAEAPNKKQTQDSKSITLLKISVKDTGIGIEPKQLPTIFDEFVQADGSMTRKYSGTGLGLAICKALSNLLGGQLSVNSEVGKGSTFCLSFQTEVASINKYVNSSIKPNDSRFVIVESQEQIFPTLKNKLAELGAHQVESCPENSIESLLIESANSNQNIHVCFISSMIESMSPFTLAKRIRSLADIGTIRLVAIINDNEKENIQTYIDAGFDATISDIKQNNAVANSIAANTSYKRESFIDKNICRGNTILLVEDNRINIALAEDLLLELGAKVVIAENGQIAVDIIESRDDIDLILMDCMMPIMDGYTATQTIRQLPYVRRDLPIIALTANAMKGDREKCLSCGMNDFLAKPVRKKDLANLLAKYVEPRDLTPTDDDYQFPPGHFSQPIANIPGNEYEENKQEKVKPQTNTIEDSEQEHNSNRPHLEENTASSVETLHQNSSSLDNTALDKMRASMKSRFPTMIEYFLEDSEQYINQIHDGMNNRDFEQLTIPSHTLKSSSKQMGAFELSELARQIEESSRNKDGDIEDLNDLIDQLDKHFCVVKSDFNSILKQENLN